MILIRKSGIPAWKQKEHPPRQNEWLENKLLLYPATRKQCLNLRWNCEYVHVCPLDLTKRGCCGLAGTFLIISERAFTGHNSDCGILSKGNLSTFCLNCRVLDQTMSTQTACFPTNCTCLWANCLSQSKSPCLLGTRLDFLNISIKASTHAAQKETSSGFSKLRVFFTSTKILGVMGWACLTTCVECLKIDRSICLTRTQLNAATSALSQWCIVLTPKR